MRYGAIAASVTFFILCGAATAQEVPDLRGKWVKVEQRGGAVRRGEFQHLPSTGREIVFGDPLAWTLTVERQDGAVFSGTWASQNRTDPLLGAVSANGRDVYMADDNGTIHGELRTPDEMEICRGLGGPDTMLATCRIFTRRR